MAKKKIFLTGGSGFVGRNILEQLSEDYEFTAPKRNELDLLNAQEVENFLKGHEFDIVLHCANIGGTRSNPGPPNMAELNLRIFFNIVRCQKHFGKIIHWGSGAEYGKQTDIKDAKEEDFDSRVPKDPYGFYKYVCAKYIEQNEGITSLRLFGCYGKYEDASCKFISNAICRAISGMPITINNKNVVFSYLYIDDLIEVLEYIIENETKQKIYNITPDEKVDLLTIAKIVKKISGSDIAIDVKNPGIGLEYSGSNQRLKQEIPGIKFTDIETGINKLYDWYQNNKDKIDKNKLLFDK